MMYVAEQSTETTGWDLVQISPDGRDPRWSPDGTLIAFYSQGINTIAPDGDNQVTVIPNVVNPCPWKMDTYYEYPRWSPTSTHLIYRRIEGANSAPYFKGDVCRATAAGEDQVVLTKDLRDVVSSVPVGWMEIEVAPSGF